MNHDEMLDHLAKLNRDLDQLQVHPLVSNDTAADMADDALADVIRGTEVYLAHIAQQLGGLY